MPTVLLSSTESPFLGSLWMGGKLFSLPCSSSLWLLSPLFPTGETPLWHSTRLDSCSPPLPTSCFPSSILGRYLHLQGPSGCHYSLSSCLGSSLFGWPLPWVQSAFSPQVPFILRLLPQEPIRPGPAPTCSSARAFVGLH